MSWFNNDFSLNFGLFVSYLLGMMRTDFNFNGLMDTSAFVVGFPILFALCQLFILPFVYDFPDSLGQADCQSLSKVFKLEHVEL